MNIAIFYTGEARTIETTIHLFKKNVLLNNNYHVFAILQSNNIDLHDKIIKETIGDNIKNIHWFDKNDQEWLQIKEKQLNKIDIPNNWKNYLSNSGSMVEHYQMYLAYKLLEKYENENNFHYDYVFRFRTDTVIKDCIDFENFHFEKSYIHYLLHKIKDFLNIDTIISQKVLDIFMVTFYNEKRIYYNDLFISKYSNNSCNKLLEIENEEVFIDSLVNYLKNGNYIIAFRENVIYFVKRNLMTNIHVLGITYGNYKIDDDYWFNAESQFKSICIDNNIDFFSSTTSLEGKSLYEYNYNNYFENENLRDDNYSFFIKRH
jgi:hypothetical protein